MASFVSILQEHCVKQQQVFPTYEISGYQTKFQCTVNLGERKCIGYGASKQSAKQDAAKNMLELLGLSEISSHLPKETIGMNVIGELNEFCSKNRLPYAIYDDNVNNQGQFVVTCELEGLKTEGVDFIKKQAKQKASHLMLQKFKINQNERAFPSMSALISSLKINKKEEEVMTENIKLGSSFPNTLQNMNKISPQKNTVANTLQPDPISQLNIYTSQQKLINPKYLELPMTDGQFIFACELNGQRVTGAGSNKKDAKKKAAEEMLIKLGQPIQTVCSPDILPKYPSKPYKEVATAYRNATDQDSSKTTKIYSESPEVMALISRLTFLNVEIDIQETHSNPVILIVTFRKEGNRQVISRSGSNYDSLIKTILEDACKMYEDN